MLLLELTEAAQLVSSWLTNEQPGPLVPWHVLKTGNGACFVDRLPNPRGTLCVSGSNYALLGSADAFGAADLQAHINGFLDTAEESEPALRRAFPTMVAWPRVNLEQLAESRPHAPRLDAAVRRLTADDAFQLWALPADVAWICSTWSGPPGLAASGYAWGAFVDGRLAALACTYFVAQRYEDIGVVTLADYRGRGLSPVCAAALCAEIHGRGRRPSWSTSPDNAASLRVAAKLGFVLHHPDQLWVIGRATPGHAEPSSNAFGK